MRSTAAVDSAPSLRPRPVAPPVSAFPIPAPKLERSVEEEVAGRRVARHGGCRRCRASDYERAWREVRFDQLTAGLAAQAHALARCNVEKFAALRRLYAGLRVMAVMVAGLVAFAALTAVVPSLRG